MTDVKLPLFSRPLVRMGLIAGGAAVATILVMALYSSVSSRKAEARQTSLKLVNLDEKTVDPA
ncbi:MAG: ammonia-forming cytochrome c nitrite reductase subunit c552, partial [Holophaga sp.]|nr:ammonia-forming cytochrome c nitrite reductase subunit c552 [Holophaga sp.]